MKFLTNEAKVGLFAIIAFVIIGFLTFKLGDFSLFRSTGGDSYLVRMDTAGLLEANADVLVSGVIKGEVSEIKLNKGLVEIKVIVEKDAYIRIDSEVQIKSRGLMGEAYLEFTPVSRNAPLAQNGYVFEGFSVKSMSDLQDSMGSLVDKLSSIGDDIKAVTSNLRGVLGTPDGELKIHNIVDNVERLTHNLDQMIIENRENLKSTIDNASNIVGNINKTIPNLLEKFERLISDLNSIIADNRDNISGSMSNIKKITDKAQNAIDSINSITEKIDKGQGTIGKLINDDKIHENLDTTLTEIKDTLSTAKDYFGRIQRTKLFFGYSGEYMTDIGKTKSYVSLILQPNPKKFYYAALVNDPYGDISIEDTREVITTNTYDANNFWTGRDKIIRETREETKTDKYKFSLQYGYSFSDYLTFRGGLFESEGGVGLDIIYNRAKLSLSFEAWDFDDDDFDPHLKLYSRFNIYKGLFFTVGYDNFLNSDFDEFFLGGGISFEDDDLKYLLGHIPIPGL